MQTWLLDTGNFGKRMTEWALDKRWCEIILCIAYNKTQSQLFNTETNYLGPLQIPKRHGYIEHYFSATVGDSTIMFVSFFCLQHHWSLFLLHKKYIQIYVYQLSTSTAFCLKLYLNIFCSFCPVKTDRNDFLFNCIGFDYINQSTYSHMLELTVHENAVFLSLM